MQRSKRRKQKKSNNQFSISTEKWVQRINERIEPFYNKYSTDKNCMKTISKEIFSKQFPESTPLIIEQIPDFTLTLSNASEEKAMPVINLTENEVPNLKNPDNQAAKVLSMAKESYLYIADCLNKF